MTQMRYFDCAQYKIGADFHIVDNQADAESQHIYYLRKSASSASSVFFQDSLLLPTAAIAVIPQRSKESVAFAVCGLGGWGRLKIVETGRAPSLHHIHYARDDL
ncbi:MAG: hypothetical protein FWF09_05970 [Bacteroidales bacterium]|nr:hypothetical protein [Bacteroidales bacterium]